MTTVAEFIKKLRVLDPSGDLPIRIAAFENPGAYGELEELPEPEIAWMVREEHNLIDLRTGLPFSYVTERWASKNCPNAERVVRI